MKLTKIELKITASSVLARTLLAFPSFQFPVLISLSPGFSESQRAHWEKACMNQAASPPGWPPDPAPGLPLVVALVA